MTTDSLNMSIDDTDTSSSDALKLELESVKAELAALKAKTDPLLNLFKRNSKGSTFTYSPELKTMGVSLLTENESAPSITRFFKALSVAFPVLLDHPSEKTSIPTPRYFANLRSLIPALNKTQIRQVVEKSTALTVCVDSSPIMGKNDILGQG